MVPAGQSRRVVCSGPSHPSAMDDGSVETADEAFSADYDDDGLERRDTEIGNVRVCVRVRPPTDDEKAGLVPGGANCVDVEAGTVSVQTGKRGAVERHPFSFDYIFGPTCTQEEVGAHRASSPHPRAFVHLCLHGGMELHRRCRQRGDLWVGWAGVHG